MITELTAIANKYNTDKGTEYIGDINEISSISSLGGSIHHGYTEFYDYYFRKYRYSCPTILEIGVEKGGSLKMMNEYFKGNCIIYCIDNDDACKNIAESVGTNIYFNLIDQSNHSELNNFCFGLQKSNVVFDIIIDDGSHISKHQMLTVKYLYKYLKKDGIYIIEDIHTSYYNTHNENVNNDYYSPISFFTKYTDYAYYTKEENNKIHNDLQSSILFVNKNVNGINISVSDNDITCSTLFLKFKK